MQSLALLHAYHSKQTIPLDKPDKLDDSVPSNEGSKTRLERTLSYSFARKQSCKVGDDAIHSLGDIQFNKMHTEYIINKLYCFFAVFILKRGLKKE